MKDKELRKLIGSRAKQRRTELNLTQPYIAEKMGVTASTIQRYEAGTIDNTKKNGAGRSFRSSTCICGMAERGNRRIRNRHYG